MVKVIAEIGINHNGSIKLCKEMMMLAKVAGAIMPKYKKEIQMCVFLKVKNLNLNQHHGVT